MFKNQLQICLLLIKKSLRIFSKNILIVICWPSVGTFVPSLLVSKSSRSKKLESLSQPHIFYIQFGDGDGPNLYRVKKSRLKYMSV